MTMLKTEQSGASVARPLRGYLLVGGLVLAGTLIAGCGDDDSGDAAGTGPAAVLADYEATKNAGDVDALMLLYADDAVVVSHPQAVGDATGHDEIRLLLINVPNVQRAEDATEFVNVEVSGSRVTFDSIWFNADEDCFGISSNEVTVQDGKITRYVWGMTGADSLCD